MTLRELRESTGLKQAEVARRMKMSRVAVWKLENSGSARIGTLEEYATATGIPFDEVREVARQQRDNVNSQSQNLLT